MKGDDISRSIERRIRFVRPRVVKQIKLPQTSAEAIRDAFGRPPDAHNRDDLPKSLFGIPLVISNRAPRDGLLILDTRQKEDGDER